MRILFLAFLTLASCRDDANSLSGVSLDLVAFAGHRPTSASLEKASSDSSAQAPFARASLHYSLGPDDSLEVVIEEFKDDISAYAFWLNNGLGPEAMPRIMGSHVQQSIWIGRWIFLFQSLPWRLPETKSMESLVHSFSGSASSLPVQFLTLPLRGRQASGASVQAGTFLGSPLKASMLCQRYRDETGPWSIARSLAEVNEGEMDMYLRDLVGHGVKTISASDGIFVFSDGATRIVLGRLGGHLTAVWGELDASTLLGFWQEAKASMRAE